MATQQKLLTLKSFQKETKKHFTVSTYLTLICWHKLYRKTYYIIYLTVQQDLLILNNKDISFYALVWDHSFNMCTNFSKN